MQRLRLVVGLGLVVLVSLGVVARRRQITHVTPQGETRVQVDFTGGYDTDPRDMGRPVVLIASALGVPTEVFREAFSHVHPAPAGQRPDPEEVRRNKDELLKVLGPYGVTNERLDEVSNYYRYNRSRGEMWRTEEAVAEALVKNGKITGFEVKSGGAGYSSVPTVTVPGVEGNVIEVRVGYSPVLEENGAVIGIAVRQGK